MTFKIHFDAGSIRYKNKKYDEALVKFQQVVRLNPTHYEAWWYIGQCQCNIKPPNYQAALAAFENAVKANPKSAYNYSGVAHAQKALGNLDAARAAYEKASALEPRFYQSHYYLANILLQSGEHAKALEYAKKCMALNPGYPEQGWLAKIETINALFRGGVTFYETKPVRDFSGALQKFQQVVRLNPTHHEAWWYIGQCQCNIKPPNYQAALAAFENAVKANPKSAYNYSGVAHAQKALGNLDAARAAYEKASALEPRFYQSHYYLANILLQSGEHAKALEYAKKCMALNPGYPEQGWLAKIETINALFRGGVTFYETKPVRDFSGALQKFQQVVRLNPTHHEAWWYIGQCQCNIKPPNYQAALTAFENAVKANPKSAYNYSGVAHAQKALGNLDAARAAYEKASALEPRFYQSHYYLANILLQSGEHAKALEYAKKCMALNPGYPEQGWLAKIETINALFRGGVTFYETKPVRDFSGALQKFQQVVRLNPTHHEAWWYIGQCQCNIKPPNYQAALTAFENAVKANPKNAYNYSGVAHAQKALGNLDAARVAYEKASALEPRFYQSHYYLANILLQSGEHAKALEYALMCIALAPTYPEQGWFEKIVAANGFQASSPTADLIDFQRELARMARYSGLEIAITAINIRGKIYDYLNTPTEPKQKKQQDDIGSIINRDIKLAAELTKGKIPGLKYINFVVDTYKNVEDSEGKTLGEKLICGTVKTTTSYGVTWYITTKLSLPPALAAFSFSKNPVLASGVAGAIAAAVGPIIKRYVADKLAELSEHACHAAFDLVQPQLSKPAPSIQVAKPPASSSKTVALPPKPAATVTPKPSSKPAVASSSRKKHTGRDEGELLREEFLRRAERLQDEHKKRDEFWREKQREADKKRAIEDEKRRHDEAVKRESERRRQEREREEERRRSQQRIDALKRTDLGKASSGGVFSSKQHCPVGTVPKGQGICLGVDIKFG
ncbi:tetratricopeptide repeat protein [Legionella geestiana]|uniref:tetratricopeptide repeat protein n=2 Tax=Legionella geestiana TaxID=45065 RepID=UPI0010741134|nr:tetratricopeptide repeat protein [Legionella geestiana]QBS12891.1 tetratricopeptide repeat protein [Legionella geestiana]QDQ39418.1 tetratricopeptide repeat protein [Legionella geestiana]